MIEHPLQLLFWVLVTLCIYPSAEIKQIHLWSEIDPSKSVTIQKWYFGLVLCQPCFHPHCSWEHGAGPTLVLIMPTTTLPSSKCTEVPQIIVNILRMFHDTLHCRVYGSTLVLIMPHTTLQSNKCTQDNCEYSNILKMVHYTIQ